MAMATAEAEYSLPGYLPLNIPTLITTHTLGQAIAHKAAAIYPFYRDNATKAGPQPRTIRCEECRRRRTKCEHNAAPVTGTLSETKAIAKEAFQFFIDECHANVFDIAGRAREFLVQKRKRDGGDYGEKGETEEKETPLLVELIMGIVGIITCYQTNLCHAPTQIPELLIRYNSLPKGTERVMTAPVGYAEERSEWIWVFEALIVSLEGQGPDGREWDEGEVEGEDQMVVDGAAVAETVAA